ncbi:MAG: radical SAM protein [Candidatus Bathyarchaeota archaeon]|nr:radical SAM protein [Candidatus Bathyarchaeota archaeon]
MEQISPETIWKTDEKELASLLNANLVAPKTRKIHFYAPSFMYYKTSYYHVSPMAFPTISITGKGCALKCKHCGGKVLETMHSATTPEKLFELCSRLKREGALGCLISGGCLPNGSVPLENFVDAIGKVKRDFGLTVFVHTGIIDFFMAKRLKDVGVDAALIDIIGSDETIREIYNLDVTVKDYENSLKNLSEAEITFVPHVIVGLHHGRLKGELNALKVISKYKPSALVIIAFMPIHGTEMEKIEPPKPLDIARVIAIARLMFPKTPIVLGCMRPKGKHRTETDVLAVKAGVNAIAFPTEEVIKFTESQGYEIAFSSFCCSQIYLDFSKG